MPLSKSTAPTRRRSRSPSRAKSRKSPIHYQPGKGLLVSTKAMFPGSADEKVVVAKYIIQAVVAAQDALQGENYDVHWPLSMAVEPLERASEQLDQESTGRAPQ
ncbi:MAG TPA: hypothetical protein VGN43_06635 [Steroidobacteraceae bacterium]|nr:hypothetical protein [Steroidobacteraceae bacterium]